MKWEAHTNSEQIGVGTTFSVWAVPQIAGQPHDELANDVELWLVQHSRPWMRTTVVSVSHDEVLIENENGVRWLMGRMRQGDIGSGPAMKELYSENWKVRSVSN